ncbi:MAG: TIGR03620 family F420-dependent LLM class oxidoreductase [Acidobacteria bacterium]|nr:TIGR03620 family F420-dependent LLM class oxidoreductase [Acidobacteriota bacterium]
MGMARDMGLGRLGIWTSALGSQPPSVIRRAAAELDELGVAALWLPEASWTDPFLIAAHALDATKSLKVATGIANLYARTARAMSNAADALGAWHPGRFILGIGVSHRPLVENTHHGDYSSPLSAMRQYLDELDDASLAGVRPDRVLAAVGPKMVELAAERAAGAHPYNMPAAHTAGARAGLGPSPILAPEVKVLFEKSPDAARAIARKNLPLRLPNYANGLIRLGFDADAVARVDDDVVDAIVGWGDDDTIRAHIQSYLDAGADHVAVQVLTADGHVPTEEWRRVVGLFA